LADVYGLEAGDVIKLDELVGSEIEVRVGNYVRFKAKPGTVEGRLAAEVTEIVNAEESSEGEGRGN
jgi:flagellar motor switch protein FliM